MTENEYKKSWKERGYSFGSGTVTLERGVNQASHDDQDELVVAVNGLLEFTIDERTFVADCDKEVFIPAKSVHSIKNIGSEGSVIYFGYKSTNL